MTDCEKLSTSEIYGSPSRAYLHSQALVTLEEWKFIGNPPRDLGFEQVNRSEDSETLAITIALPVLNRP
jgi:hypothetical protein